VTVAAVLQARELYRFFHAGPEEVLALRGVTLAVRAGELVAVVGPSGSGKSTLLGCLAGLDDPDGGVVWVAGRRVSRVPERERARLRAGTIGVLLQSGNLIEHLSVAQNMAVAQAAAGRRARAADRAELLDRLGLAGRADAVPATLSGGEAARAGLAVALANQPAVLLADEPTGELDSATEAEVAALLREQADRHGTAVLAVTHSAGLAAVADRVLALHDGRLVS
jgi:putative ABC transport system ATP-binding protein